MGLRGIGGWDELTIGATSCADETLRRPIVAKARMTRAESSASLRPLREQFVSSPGSKKLTLSWCCGPFRSNSSTMFTSRILMNLLLVRIAEFDPQHGA